MTAMRAAIIIPTLDEAGNIGRLLQQVTRQSPDRVPHIIVVDGGSTDGTRQIVETWARDDPRVRLLDNPQRIQSAGINRAVATLPSDLPLFIRVDAHARYPADYIGRILQMFERTGADLVSTRLRTIGETCVQRGIAAASNSLGGNGGSAHRRGGRSGYVDHGHHAGISTALFRRVGGYDERWVTNEDAEFDLRARRAGGRIWLAAGIEAEYLPRASLRALARQYHRYGRGRAQTYLAHGEPLRLRQLVPPLICVAIAVSLLMAPIAPPLLLIPAAYLLLLGGLTLALLGRERSLCTLFAGPAMAVMHLAWGAGFLEVMVAGPRFQPGTKPASHALEPLQEGGA